jgi:hypothetical protein
MKEEDLEMAKSDDVTPQAKVQEDVVFMPLRQFADTYAKQYGIELMGGFYHVQESLKKFADTEANWHKAIEKFSKEEVK